MRISYNTIIFNSTDVNFWKEFRVKNNTARILRPNEILENNLQVMPDGRLYSTGKLITHIKICLKSDPSNVYIHKPLKDVMIYEGLYIFSF